ncbi:MAG: redoxin domain-containing protein [Candidatus Binatia bacterium]
MTERTITPPAIPQTPTFAGRIGITLLCIYLFIVTLRIDGCYAPDPANRDELPDNGPVVGSEFPAFSLRDLAGATITRDDLQGSMAIVIVVPTLDWSPPTKASLVDLATALRGRHDVRVAVVLPSAQATPRSLTFPRDHHLPFYFLVDDGGLIDRLGLTTAAPDRTASAFPATFVLDAQGRVRLRDVRKNARAWLAPETVLAADLSRDDTSAPPAP